MTQASTHLPLVDVVIAVHDASRPIARSVASVLENNRSLIRVIVVAHNLPIGKIQAALGQWADDERVVLVHLQDGVPSPSGPMNLGFDAATAPFVTLLGSDDTFEPGTLDRWLAIARAEGADFVIANRQEPDGVYAPSPPVRIGRRNRLNGAKDRLSYRAAPLGLMRRSKFGHLRFPQGVPTGEDVPFSSHIWFSGARISFAFGSPGYLVHADQEQRATTDPRPVEDSLRWLATTLDPTQPWMRRAADRTSLLVKILRQNIPDVARAHLPDIWDEAARSQMRQAILAIHSADTRAFDYLSRADWDLIETLRAGEATEATVTALLAKRGDIRSVDALIPHRPHLLFASQAPLRTHLAARALVSAGEHEVRLARTRDLHGSRGRMIFHAPFPVEEGATSASGIRPWKMLEAFRDLGYDVFTITGHARQRKAQFALLRRMMGEGWSPDFCYSEAATIPSSFTEPRHFPLVLNLERTFFRFLHGRGVPSGVFYRDVYWAFPDYVDSVGWTVAAAMRRLYRREIETFNKYVNVVFLPTKQMASFIRGLNVPTVALPPGADAVTEQDDRPPHNQILRLLYVGDVGGEHYDISALLDAVNDVEGVTLTICTRPESWERARSEYQEFLSDRIQVVHQSGAGLVPLYRESDVACLVMKPREYRSFAAPMKLYEYLGHGKPVLASEDTHASEVVDREAVGWSVPFNAEDIAGVLRRLGRDHGEVAEKAAKAREVGARNTWQDRAESAARVLKGVRGDAANCTRQEAATGASRPELHVLVVPSWYPKDLTDAHGSFFREQAEALAASGMKVGVLALEMVSVQGAGRGTSLLEGAVENGVFVVRGKTPKWIPMQRALNVKLAKRCLDRAWSAYVVEHGVPDVVHAHSLFPGAFLARELSREHGVPFVYTEHRTLDHMPVKTDVGKWVENEVASTAASRRAVSKGHAAHLARRFPGMRWGYSPNLLPRAMEREESLAERSARDTYTFGHLSVPDPVKRVDRLIDAFAELHAHDPAVRLVLGGSGGQEQQLKTKVEELGLVDSVEFVGAVPRADIADFYRSIDSFVLPSSSETMGVVQIEALAAGVPVISTRTWGGETVIEEGDGLLVDIDNHEQLVDAMKQVRSWKDSAADRQARRERCIARFGREAFVERHRRIYEQARAR